MHRSLVKPANNDFNSSASLTLTLPFLKKDLMMTARTLAISVQIYSLRTIIGLDRQLDAAAVAGYRHVELIGAHLDNAADTRAKLDARGLKPSSSHVSIAALRERFDAVMKACGTLGITQLFMPSVPLEERNSGGAYWSALGRELGQFSCRAKEYGIALGYHNHNWELKQKDGGVTALELLFDGAADSPLTWQVDVAWLVRAGVDPTLWMQRYRDRIVSVHAKDLAPGGERLDEDGWADVGSGILNWNELWLACRDAGAKWLVAEHDRPNDPERFLRASYGFLSNLKA